MTHHVHNHKDAHDAVYHVLTVAVELDRADEADAWFRDVAGVEPVVVERAGSPLCWIEIYHTLASDAEQLQERSDGCDWAIDSAIRICEPRDWQSFWKQHFQPMDVGRRLRIVPEWAVEDEAPENERLRVVIQPGLSFGTGLSFTTRFCLEGLERVRAGFSSAPSLLDAGAGSGILSIAALRLGYGAVTALDFDPQCLRQVELNARLNSLEDRVQTGSADLTDWQTDRRYDVVCANVYARILIQAAGSLSAAAGGVLVLSGVREEQADETAAAYRAHGLEEFCRDGDGEWCGLLFRRP